MAEIKKPSGGGYGTQDSGDVGDMQQGAEEHAAKGIRHEGAPKCTTVGATQSPKTYRPQASGGEGG